VTKQKLLTTIAAFLCAVALSASAVVAAPGPKVEGGADSVKPAKNDQHDRGRHLGQAKHNETTEPGDSDSEELGPDHERKQNHGWFVSQVAHDKSLTGRAHGKAVSEVAHSDQGKPEKAKH
jgi:hypothetical protein